jgi:hypothetical protein
MALASDEVPADQCGLSPETKVLTTKGPEVRRNSSYNSAIRVAVVKTKAPIQSCKRSYS